MQSIPKDAKGMQVSGSFSPIPEKCCKCGQQPTQIETVGQYSLLAYCDEHAEQVQTEREEYRELMAVLSPAEKAQLDECEDYVRLGRGDELTQIWSYVLDSIDGLRDKAVTLDKLSGQWMTNEKLAREIIAAAKSRLAIA